MASGEEFHAEDAEGTRRTQRRQEQGGLPDSRSPECPPRSHAERGNAVLDALRRLRPSLGRGRPESPRRSLEDGIPTLRVGTSWTLRSDGSPSSTLCGVCGSSPGRSRPENPRRSLEDGIPTRSVGTSWTSRSAGLPSPTLCVVCAPPSGGVDRRGRGGASQSAFPRGAWERDAPCGLPDLAGWKLQSGPLEFATSSSSPASSAVLCVLCVKRIQFDPTPATHCLLGHP